VSASGDVKRNLVIRVY